MRVASRGAYLRWAGSLGLIGGVVCESGQQVAYLRVTQCWVREARRPLCLSSSLKRWEEKPLQRSMFPRPSSYRTHTHS